MATSGQVEEIGTNFILPVAANLEKAGQPGAPILEIACGICLWRTLDISTKVRGLIEAECRLRPEEAAQSKDAFYEKHQLEYTIFLKCGHLVGATCWEAQMARPDMSARQCNFCKANLLCDGCPNRVLMDDTFDPVQWPLDPAQYQPYQEFQAKVALTAAEVDPEAPRFCSDCAKWQVRRKFADILLTFPRCHGDGCFPPAPGSQALPPPPAPGTSHALWRQENVAKWVRQKVVELSHLIHPRTNDVRDPQVRAQVEAEFATMRRSVQDYLLANQRVAAAGQLAFRPCQSPESGSNGAQAQVTAQQVSEGLALVEMHLRVFYADSTARVPGAWYRGGEVPFVLHPPEVQVEMPDLDGDACKAVQYLLMTVGADSVEEARGLIHPAVTAGSSINEIIGRFQAIVALLQDEIQ
ncbi:hypothetical protein PG993_011387 [Apiospora rasikravindrae]|uniref:RING-type domain-containing protein n=1 Tax=Apiospora rasikravindrae TaxID=990691 RepID=A0ABR1SE34_9PEZI